MNLDNLPQNSGVYIFKDSKNKPIYVGKALNIRKRVKGHFSPKTGTPKGNLLLEKIDAVESIRIDSEIEALILEANLIKKYKPHFNSQLKDDKDYLYIKITRDPYPKVLVSRKKDLKNAKLFFGPFPSATKVRTTLKILRKIFQFTSCNPNRKRACLYYHLGLCPGVCIGLISQKEYRKNIRGVIYMLGGKQGKLLDVLEKEVRRFARNLEFEKAQMGQQKIEALHYVTQPIRILEHPEVDREELRQREITELARILDLPQRPARIECYDISNFSGKQATGSLVVFTNGFADRSQYRRFKIKFVEGPNDTAMISEILERRFKNDWGHPDLVLIDGGKGQLNAALKVVASFNLSLPVISLAKRLEEIYWADKTEPLRLPRESSALKLLQRIRDEAHRFAITYHRKLRSKQFLTGA
ncbi:MAG: excinuclease ABC subunit UvrC [bacterium]|nr:excinuclease ABC subunit UvrC [bacterium]